MSSDQTYTKQEDSVMKRVIDYINTQVMDDQKLVKTILMVGLSAYTSKPLNLMINAPFSEGKTYSAMQVLNLFPRKDVLFLGGMSPSALVHEQGTLVDEEGDPVEEKVSELHQKIIKCKDNKEKQELEEQRQNILKNTKNLVDLQGKILVFLDTPHWELWRKLKPILSHDKEEIEFKIADRKNNSLFTKTTIISGWPSVICCSAKNEEMYQDWEEIQSRFLIKSPNTDVTKYKKANQFIALKYSTPGFAKSKYNNERERNYVRQIIVEIKEKFIRFDDPDICFNPFNQIIAESLPSNEGSTMRITEKFFALCDLETQINSENRCKLVNERCPSIEYLITDISDIENTIELLDNPTTLPPDKVKFVNNILKPALLETLDGYITTTILAEKYRKVYGKPITPKKILESYLKSLESVGIIEWKEDPNDRRIHLYRLASEIKENTFDYIKSKIIEYSKNNPSYVESYVNELSDNSLAEANGDCHTHVLDDPTHDIIRILDPNGNLILIDGLQSFLLSEVGSQTNIIPVT